MSNGLEKTSWGEVDGRAVDLYTLTNRQGLRAKISTYGGIVTELHVQDREGRFGDVVLGYEGLGPYLKKTPYFGAIVGRVGNRIAGAAFDLDGETYRLAANDGANHLHGGVRGWDKVVWDAAAAETADGPALKLTYESNDGEEGYPGTVQALVIYTLTDEGALRVEMTATTDRATPINMVHHSYWNLNSEDRRGDIREHLLTLHASRYTPGMPPAGEIAPVSGTPFDFTREKPIGRDLAAAGSPAPGTPIGYDHNWVVDGDPGALRPVARIFDPRSGRILTLSANQPGVQFYSGIFLDGSTSGKGRTHVQYGGLCLESQRFPNAINVPSWRAQAILRPGETYRHVMVHAFTTDRA